MKIEVDIAEGTQPSWTVGDPVRSKFSMSVSFCGVQSDSMHENHMLFVLDKEDAKWGGGRQTWGSG